MTEGRRTGCGHHKFGKLTQARYIQAALVSLLQTSASESLIMASKKTVNCCSHCVSLQTVHKIGAKDENCIARHAVPQRDQLKETADRHDRIYSPYAVSHAGWDSLAVVDCACDR